MRSSPLRGGAVAVTLSVGMALCTLPAAAAPPPAPAAPVTRQVTLVTGTQVLYQRTADGKQSATVIGGASGSGLHSWLERGHLYVIPAQAAPLLADNRLDRRLFDVTTLVDQGYDDASTTKLPLLTSHANSTAAAQHVPAGANVTATLRSANSTAFTVDKAKAGEFWAGLTSGSRMAAPAKLWLDAKVRASLEHSVPQIGAPQAWARGHDGTGATVAVLDTGYDSKHPDLAGRVALAENFTPDADVEDGHGHGTHVASILAGTGAASGGKRKGVAPGARLLIGKVLDNYGTGTLSEIIRGMEWAVEQRADVVSMSIGSTEINACDDPMALAVDQLSAQSRTLFVIAAGNSGRDGRQTINSPGCAASALTVGAVDREDRLAPFSSLGPVFGDHRVKPDISAPGVDIQAARSGGRGEQAYRPSSGTSMATPHVSGAAAVLAKARPELTGQQLKALLISTAKSSEDSVYRQGAGRLDLARADRQLVSGAGSVDFGSFSWPHGPDQRAQRELAFRNDSATPVTLDLSLRAKAENDTELPAGMFKLSTPTVVVPAKGSATATVELDASKPLTDNGYGAISGHVIGRSSGGDQVIVPLGGWLEPKTVTLTIKHLDRRGLPAGGYGTVDLLNLDQMSGEHVPSLDPDQPVVRRVRVGTYSLASYLYTPDAATGYEGVNRSLAFVSDPQLKIDRDLTVVHDARRATRIEVSGDRPMVPGGTRLDYGRWKQDLIASTGHATGPEVTEVYAQPTEKVTDGGFAFTSSFRLHAKEISLTTLTRPAVPLDPLYSQRFGVEFGARLDGRGEVGLVDAGRGTAAELDAAGPRGKMVLVRKPEDPVALMERATAAGAVALLVGNSEPGRWLADGTWITTVPTLAISGSETDALLDQLRRGSVRLRYEAARSPYNYNLSFDDHGQVSAQQKHVVRDRELAQVESTVYSHQQPGQWLDIMTLRPQWSPAAIWLDMTGLTAPGTRTELYSPGSQWQRMMRASSFTGPLLERPRQFRAGERHTDSWYRQVARPVPFLDDQGTALPLGTRTGNGMSFLVAPFGDSDSGHYGYRAGIDLAELTVLRDGKEVGWFSTPNGDLTVPDGRDAEYTVKVESGRQHYLHPYWQLSTHAETKWTFRSAATAKTSPLPLWTVNYRADLDTRNTAPRVWAFPVTVEVTPQPGWRGGWVDRVQASVSYDEGKHWERVPTIGVNGRAVALVDNTRAGAGAVSLKVAASGAGGSVEQSVTRAYSVR